MTPDTAGKIMHGLTMREWYKNSKEYRALAAQRDLTSQEIEDIVELQVARGLGVAIIKVDGRPGEGYVYIDPTRPDDDLRPGPCPRIAWAVNPANSNTETGRSFGLRPTDIAPSCHVDSPNCTCSDTSTSLHYAVGRSRKQKMGTALRRLFKKR